MKLEAAAILGIAFVATCLGAPLDIGTGLDLTPGDLDFWSKDIEIGGQSIQVGLGWSQVDGTIAVGTKVLPEVNGKQMPVSAALRTNINDWKRITYEVGTNVKDTVSAVVIGDFDGNVSYQVNGKVPVKVTGLNSIGASLQGSGQQNVLTGGVAVGQEVIQAVVGLDGLKPYSFNVQVGANTSSK